MAFLLGNSGLRRRHALRKPRLGDKCVTELPQESSVTVFIEFVNFGGQQPTGEPCGYTEPGPSHLTTDFLKPALLVGGISQM